MLVKRRPLVTVCTVGTRSALVGPVFSVAVQFRCVLVFLQQDLPARAEVNASQSDQESVKVYVFCPVLKVAPGESPAGGKQRARAVPDDPNRLLISAVLVNSGTDSPGVSDAPRVSPGPVSGATAGSLPG